jgi:hypothetical protein
MDEKQGDRASSYAPAGATGRASCQRNIMGLTYCRWSDFWIGATIQQRGQKVNLIKMNWRRVDAFFLLAGLCAAPAVSIGVVFLF